MRKSGSFSDRFRSRVDFCGLVDFLRQSHPQKTAESVEAHCGISACTVKKWLTGETRPNGEALAILTIAYGPKLFATCFRCAPDWLVNAVNGQMSAEIHADIEAKQRELKELSNF